MPKEVIKFDDFLMTVEPDNLGFVISLHEYLLQNGCTINILSAKSGYVVSYYYSKKVIANYVFRKKGLLIRIYAENIGSYGGFLDGLPEEMIKAIEKASACKRLLDPLKCNSRCPMGYVFTLKGEDYKKCRYGCFMFQVNAESEPYIKTFLEKELKERMA